MTDRLKQIWSGFEQQTSRHLTGNGIDNIHVPNRREWRAEDTKFLGENFEAPADRAFAALQYKLAEAEHKYGRKRSAFKPSRQKAQASFRNTDMGADMSPDHQQEAAGYTKSAYGPSVEAQTPNVATGDPRQALLASLKETDFRVLRREINYMAQGADKTAREMKKRNRKKFLGIF